MQAAAAPAEEFITNVGGEGTDKDDQTKGSSDQPSGSSASEKKKKKKKSKSKGKDKGAEEKAETPDE